MTRSRRARTLAALVLAREAMLAAWGCVSFGDGCARGAGLNGVQGR